MDAWNDQALTLIRQKRWEQAIEAARRALSLDPNSSAAWFNLGRAQLGSGSPADALASLEKASALTSRQNADVEYYRGTAAHRAGDSQAAERIFRAALLLFPDDKEIAAALAEAQKAAAEAAEQKGERTFLLDLDGDGAQETVKARGANLTVTNGRGEILYQMTGPASGDPAGGDLRIARADKLPDGTILVHLEWAGCPTYPNNTFFYREKASGTYVGIGDYASPCLGIVYDGDGHYSAWFRAAPLAYAQDLKWNGHGLVDGDRPMRTTLMWSPQRNNLGWVLSEIAGPRELEGWERLFATRELYDQFRSKAGPGGELGPMQRLDDATVKFEVQRGTEKLTLTLQLRQGESTGSVQIIGLRWE